MTSQKGNNYILIGMPGAGKSTIGVLLAKALGAEFIDTDLVIQQKTGKLLRDIISQEGNEAFKKIEEEVNASVEAENSVIAPGGSAIYSPKAMEHFRNIGTVIYLKLDYGLMQAMTACPGVVFKKRYAYFSEEWIDY